MKAKTGRSTLDDPPYRLARPQVDLPVPATGADALLLLDNSYAAVKDFFLQYYPKARFDLPLDPENHPLCLSVRLSRDDLAALQGLNARFTNASGDVSERTVPGIHENEPSPGITAARWSGGLRIER